MPTIQISPQNVDPGDVRNASVLHLMTRMQGPFLSLSPHMLSHTFLPYSPWGPLMPCHLATATKLHYNTSTMCAHTHLMISSDQRDVSTEALPLHDRFLSLRSRNAGQCH